MIKSEDMGEFYRIPADNRDLNYDKYFIEGKRNTDDIEDYNSHNTDRCDVDRIKHLLIKLSIINEKLNN